LLNCVQQRYALIIFNCSIIFWKSYMEDEIFLHGLNNISRIFYRLGNSVVKLVCRQWNKRKYNAIIIFISVTDRTFVHLDFLAQSAVGHFAKSSAGAAEADDHQHGRHHVKRSYNGWTSSDGARCTLCHRPLPSMVSYESLSTNNVTFSALLANERKKRCSYSRLFYSWLCVMRLGVAAGKFFLE